MAYSEKDDLIAGLLIAPQAILLLFVLSNSKEENMKEPRTFKTQAMPVNFVRPGMHFDIAGRTFEVVDIKRTVKGNGYVLEICPIYKIGSEYSEVMEEFSHALILRAGTNLKNVYVVVD